MFGRLAEAPDGDQEEPEVMRENIMAKFLGFIVTLLSMRHMYWTFDHPEKSMLWEIDMWEGFAIPRTNAKNVKFWMGAYGHQYLKPVVFYSTLPWLERIWKAKPKKTNWTRRGIMAPLPGNTFTFEFSDIIVNLFYIVSPLKVVNTSSV